MNSQIISISTWTIIRVFLILLGFWFVYVIRDVLILLFISVLLAALLQPPVAWLQVRHIPRSVGVSLIYVLLFAGLGFLTWALIPLFSDQFRQLAEAIPVYVDRLLNFFKASSESFVGIRESIRELANTFAKGTTTGVVQTFYSFFGLVVSAFVILFTSFYMVVEEDAIKRITRSIVPDQYHPFMSQLLSKMQAKVGDWLRGQLILSLIMGVSVYLMLVIMRVPYALVLGALWAILEFIPFVGPLVAALCAIVVALAESPLQAFMVTVGYLLIDQIKNHVLVPKIMQRALGLNPVVTIAAVLIGLKLNGALGGVIAIPLAAALSVLVKDFYHEYKK